jgi:8-oxo-dGTP diphosphatase
LKPFLFQYTIDLNSLGRKKLFYLSKGYAVELTTMCFIVNNHGQVLIQDRKKPDWPGWTFPGGHVEATESLKEACVREVLEETGLLIKPTFTGVVEWLNAEDGAREMAGLFSAKVKGTTVTPSAEGELFWIDKKDLQAEKLAGSLGALLPTFLGDPDSLFFNQLDSKTE